MSYIIRTIWGSASAVLDTSRRLRWFDCALALGIVGLLIGSSQLLHEASRELHPVFEIDLSFRALPKYTFFSLMRGLLAYVLSLVFTLLYGYWAAKDSRAERVLVPLLDILQSIPVLGFMPGLVIALVALFPSSNIGLELAAIVMIFTGQAWNMTFSYYHSLRSVPPDLQEAALIYKFNWFDQLRKVELPFAAIGLVWNSMMSMAGGWFFLMINESFVLGDKDFRLPGLGSYMTAAVNQGNIPAMLAAIAAMIIMIVALDQLLWRPIVVWSQKFRVEEGSSSESMTSWFWDMLRVSSLFAALRAVSRQAAKLLRCLDRRLTLRPKLIPSPRLLQVLSSLLLGIFVITIAAGLLKLLHLIAHVALEQWLSVWSAAAATLGRVLLSTALGTLWALPAGLAIGLSPRLSRLLQPVVQVAASFPAPMLFPLLVGFFAWAGIPLGWGSIILMLLGTQWYILFNVIAGAMAIPADLIEAARAYHFRGKQKFWTVYFPGVFAYLVTGWVTAAGGAWNASIVSEYVAYKGRVLTSWGLGSKISEAAAAGDFPLLGASVITMALLVVLFNRLVWRRCYRLAEQRYSLSK